MYNLYDFDKAIYDGDSSVDFFLFSITKNWLFIKYIPKDIIAIIKYKTKKISKEEMKETFFSFLREIDDLDTHVKSFWDKHNKKIKKWYLAKDHSKDIIISASPSFLIAPIGKLLKVKDVIATEVNKSNGDFISKNCYGKEKVNRLFKKYPNIKIKDAYSDSLSDMPLLRLAENQYLVNKRKVKKIN